MTIKCKYNRPRNRIRDSQIPAKVFKSAAK